MLFILEEIKEEHKGIRLMLDILEKMSLKLKAGEEVKQEHLNEMILYIEDFIESIHHRKEEEVFYPALENSSDEKEREILEIDLGEHELAKNIAKGMNEYLKRFSTGDKTVINDLVNCMKEYVDLTKIHADREDNIVLDLVNKQVPQSLKEKLFENERKSQERIGENKDSVLFNKISRLSKIYL